MLISGIFLANQTVGFIYFVFVFFLSRIKQEEHLNFSGINIKRLPVFQIL